MGRARWLVAGFLALSAVSAFAQSGVTAKDPVTGNWGVQGLVLLELQFDGASAVTGTTIWRQSGGYEQRAAIKTGTFDTRTGALKLTGEAERDGKTLPYVVEAKIKGDVLTGSSKLGKEKKNFSLTRQ